MVLRKIQRIILPFMALWMAVGVFAQTPEEEEDVEYHAAFRTGPFPKGGYRHLLLAEITSPHNIANEANARAFDGIASVQLGYGIRTVKGLYVGAMGRYTGFNIYLPPTVPGAVEGSSFSDINLTTFLMGPSISYFFHGQSGVGFMPEISGGLATIRYDGMKIAKYDNGFLTRSLFDADWFASVNLRLLFTPFEDQHTHFSFSLGGTYLGHEFKKEPLGLSGDDNLIPLSDEGGSFQLHIGLGFYFLLRKINQ